MTRVTAMGWTIGWTLRAVCLGFVIRQILLFVDVSGSVGWAVVVAALGWEAVAHVERFVKKCAEARKEDQQS